MVLDTVPATALVWLVAVTTAMVRLVPACAAVAVVGVPATVATAATPAIRAVERLVVRWPVVLAMALATALPMVRLARLVDAPRL